MIVKNLYFITISDTHMTRRDFKQLVHIPINSVKLEGELIIPEGAKAIVVFAHGSGSSRFSPRNNYVAEELRKVGLATLLFDLLTVKEDEVYETRFDIPFLTKRLEAATKWLTGEAVTKGFRVGYFGASTGAAAALEAAVSLGEVIGAVVSRGGRPDMAMESLPNVKAPTLLIVGGLDGTVIGMNESALKKLECSKKLEIIPGATHLFEEPGTLEEAARLASEWFKKYLVL